MTLRNVTILSLGRRMHVNDRNSIDLNSSIGYRASLNCVRGFIAVAHAVSASNEILSRATRVGRIANKSHIAFGASLR